MLLFAPWKRVPPNVNLCSPSSASFVRNVKAELSAATVKGNALMFQSCICQWARKTGEAF